MNFQHMVFKILTYLLFYHCFFISEEYVDGFEIDEVPVTNREFVEFIESGQYDNPNNWTSEDWQWKEKNKKSSPTSLFKQNGKWMVKTVYNSLIFAFCFFFLKKIFISIIFRLKLLKKHLKLFMQKIGANMLEFGYNIGKR